MSEAPIRASVIVPVRNGADTLAACLDALLGQDYPSERFEVIVVENASTDETTPVLERYAGRVRVIHREAPSRSGARNAGIEAARGDVVAFIDADCVAEPTWLRGMVEPLTPESQVVVAGDVLTPPGSGWVERFGDRVHDQRAAVSFVPPYASTQSCAMAAAPLRRGGGGFNPRLPHNEDVELSYRLFAAGWTFVHRPTVVFHQRNPDSLRRLFALGHRHGHSSILSLDLHRGLLRRLGSPRWSWSPYLQVITAARDVARGPDRREAVCNLVFSTGKAAGKLTGALRLRRLAS